MLAGDFFGDGIGWGVATGVAAVAAGWDFVQGVGENIYENLSDLFDQGPSEGDILWRDALPPTAAEPDAFKKSPGYGPTTAAGKKQETYKEMLERLAAQEVKTGVQSPLGPDDPNQYVPIPVQDNNQDPQAPVAPGFVPVPSPVPGGGLGQNTLLEYTNARVNNPGGDPGYKVYPKFRGKKGAGTSRPTDRMVASAVPELNGDQISWTARVQAFRSGSVVKTWNFDAGASPPSSGDFDFIFDLEVFGTVLSLLNPANWFPGDGVRRFSLSEPAVPPVLPQPETLDQDWTNVPVGPAWTGDTAPDGWVTTQDDSGTAPAPVAPPLPVPVTPVPVLPVGPVPTNPNNPTTVPAVGTNGELLKLQDAVKALGTDVHKIGGVLVNSVAMRKSLAGVAKEVGRIEQKTAQALNNNLGALQLLDDIWNLLNSMGGGGTTPAQTLKMLAACDYVAENQLAEYAVTYPEQDKIDAILSRVNDIPGFLQQHLAWKTPTCGNEKPVLEGDWFTTRWVSDAPSP
ncbi:MAG: hypothetical protein GY892_18915, partial [Shimia sp.]|nr:hypothetical protein [Shimia sp.]